MKTGNKEAKVELDCIAEIVNRLEKLRKPIIGESVGFDSVAESKANQATARVLSYLMSFYGFK